MAAEGRDAGDGGQVARAAAINRVRMKRRDLEQHLRQQGCYLHRHGRGHDIWLNPAGRAESAVPRHREIATGTARAICRQLGVAPPPGK